MNLRDAGNEVLACTEAGNAVLLVSGSGMGKTQKARQLFEQVKSRDSEKGIKWGFGTVFAATQTPTDLIGIPFKGERSFPGEMFPDGQPRTFTVTDPTVPWWMISDEGKPSHMYDKFWLVLDEYGQGEPDVKRGIAEIFLNGGTPPWYLPKGSVRLACSNEGSRYGVSKDFDFAIARRTRIEVSPDIRVWLEDFADKPYTYNGREWSVMPLTKAWATKHAEIVFEKEPEKQGPWCNPRTLVAFDRYLQIKSGNPLGKDLNLQDSRILEVGAGTCGQAATMGLMDWMKFRLELPQYEDIVKDPTGTPVPEKGDLLLLLAYELASLAIPDDMPALLQYTGRFKARDMHTTFVITAIRRNYRAFINLPSIQAWISKNSAMVTAINALVR